MKITKLIIPLLGLTSMNNANNQANAIQLEKEINMPYEILAKDNWENYLVNENATENLIKQNWITQLSTQKKEEMAGIISHSSCYEGCVNAHSIAARACCAAVYFPPAFVACQLAASAALAACIALCNAG